MEAKISFVLYNFYRPRILFAAYTIKVLDLGILKFLTKLTFGFKYCNLEVVSVLTNVMARHTIELSFVASGHTSIFKLMV